jgi:hypothetical protein
MSALLILCLAFDLSAIRQEPNLEKRSQLAIDNALVAMYAARDASVANDFAKMKESLEEVGLSAELCWQSLKDSGKNARKSPGNFKRAELKTRELMRRLDGLEQAVDSSERGEVTGVRERVSKVHDDLIQEIMRKK